MEANRRYGADPIPHVVHPDPGVFHWFTQPADDRRRGQIANRYDLRNITLDQRAALRRLYRSLLDGGMASSQARDLLYRATQDAVTFTPYPDATPYATMTMFGDIWGSPLPAPCAP